MTGKCIYCDGLLFEGLNVFEVFYRKDILCGICRKKLKRNFKTFKINNYKVESYYIYNDFFSKVLLQYKDCYDEALADVFLYEYKWLFKMKYFGYSIVIMPSHKDIENIRGFNHLKLIFENMGMDVVDCLYKKSNIRQMNQNFIDRKEIINCMGLKNCKIGNKILLVDDVCTTGYTLKAALNLLDNGRRKIKIFTISTNIKNVDDIGVN